MVGEVWGQQGEAARRKKRYQGQKGAGDNVRSKTPKESLIKLMPRKLLTHNREILDQDNFLPYL